MLVILKTLLSYEVDDVNSKNKMRASSEGRLEIMAKKYFHLNCSFALIFITCHFLILNKHHLKWQFLFFEFLSLENTKFFSHVNT